MSADINYCDECEGDIELTDVEGHYSGVCTECRTGHKKRAKLFGQPPKSPNNPNNPDRVIEPRKGLAELKRRRRAKSAGVTDWTRQKGDYMYDEGAKSEFGGNA